MFEEPLIHRYIDKGEEVSVTNVRTTTARFKVRTARERTNRTSPLLRSIASGRINDLACKIEIIPAAKPRHLYSPDLTARNVPFFPPTEYIVIPNTLGVALKCLNARVERELSAKFYSYVTLEKENRNETASRKNSALWKNHSRGETGLDKKSKSPLSQLKFYELYFKLYH